ncbi:hypothetical protein ODJ79_42275 [Actinoplanes sp. KI2]|uniref:hypothetical protein n=1 Tax=Actinoplanes sp. KI2 TaxID=2983315 RepID=UPI0021D5DBA0|nr:hypothetical protein [Actinoplanes sp. KI2]MCU7730386.1 hypothetical protein [Actinoplanes sp. KI2]
MTWQSGIAQVPFQRVMGEAGVAEHGLRGGDGRAPDGRFDQRQFGQQPGVGGLGAVQAVADQPDPGRHRSGHLAVCDAGRSERRNRRRTAVAAVTVALVRGGVATAATSLAEHRPPAFTVTPSRRRRSPRLPCPARRRRMDRAAAMTPDAARKHGSLSCSTSRRAGR